MKKIFKIVSVGIEFALVALFVSLIILYVTLPDVSSLASENPLSTHFIELRKEEAIKKNQEFTLNFQWRPLSEISPFLIYSVIYLEDTWFLNHRGLDIERIKNSLKLLWSEGKIISGASTITQQVAKNLYLSPEKTFFRKLKELFIACKMEQSLSKERILEIYLNVAEWGDGVFGAEAASHYWFQKSAHQLTPQEAARLALALPNPFIRKPTALPSQFDKYINYMILILAERGLVSQSEIQEALLQ